MYVSFSLSRLENRITGESAKQFITSQLHFEQFPSSSSTRDLSSTVERHPIRLQRNTEHAFSVGIGWNTR